MALLRKETFICMEMALKESYMKLRLSRENSNRLDKSSVRHIKSMLLTMLVVMLSTTASSRLFADAGRSVEAETDSDIGGLRVRCLVDMRRLMTVMK